MHKKEIEAKVKKYYQLKRLKKKAKEDIRILEEAVCTLTPNIKAYIKGMEAQLGL